MRRQLKKFTRPLKRKFLRLYAKYGYLSTAARLTGVSNSTIYYHIDTDLWFEGRVVRIEKINANRAVEEMYRQGIEGHVEAVWYKGEIVGHKRVKSTQCLLTYVKGRCPEFKETHRDITEDGAGNTLADLMQSLVGNKDATDRK